MSALQIGALLLYSFGIAVGQILFKVASQNVDRSSPLAVVFDPAFIAAVSLYFILSVYWSWLLSFTPLSRAYPFLGLAFVLVPVAGLVIFSEPLTWRLVVALISMTVGVILIST